MNNTKEVKVVINELDDDYQLKSIKGVILDETAQFFIIGKIEKRVLLAKRSVIRIEEIVPKSISQMFKFDKI